MDSEPARAKAADERQARAHRDDEDVYSPIALAHHVNLAVPRSTHERVEKFARARGRLDFVPAQQTAPTRTFRRRTHAHRAHVRGEGQLGEQKDHEDYEALNEDR